jgi:hypothetical protein
MFDQTKSLEELEGQVWPHNDFDSHVVQESQRLRKVPVNQLTIEDLRLLIGQQIGLQFLVPVVLDLLVLVINPLAQGAFYRGDLLANLLKLPPEFWQSHPQYNNTMVELGMELKLIQQTLADELLPSVARFEYL